MNSSSQESMMKEEEIAGKTEEQKRRENNLRNALVSDRNSQNSMIIHNSFVEASLR